nr:O-antigen export system ATP-binding protein RfbB-like [Nerophis lumbriciformis]
MTTPAIELQNLSLCYRLAKQKVGSFKEYFIHLVKGSLTYEQLWALRDINLIVQPGEVIGVLGPNGAGKSTLAKVIARVLPPTHGKRRVQGMVSPILELGTGFDHELTGVENIYLNALLLGRRKKQITERIEAIVEFSGLEKFIDTPVRNYSSGMLARLGFAVATAWTPDVLILDEVLAVGDVRFLDRCKERIDSFRDQGSTIVLVSHSAGMLSEYSTRCLWLESGRLIEDGDPLEVVERYVEHMHRPRAGAVAEEAAAAAAEELATELDQPPDEPAAASAP